MASSTLGPSQIIFIPGPIYDLNIILTRRRTVHATPPAPGTFGDAVGGWGSPRPQLGQAKRPQLWSNEAFSVSSLQSGL